MTGRSKSVYFPDGLEAAVAETGKSPGFLMELGVKAFWADRDETEVTRVTREFERRLRRAIHADAQAGERPQRKKIPGRDTGTHIPTASLPSLRRLAAGQDGAESGGDAPGAGAGPA